MHEFMTWLASQNPAWVMLVFPFIFGCAMLSIFLGWRAEKKLEADPLLMTAGQYQNFNAKRMRK